MASKQAVKGYGNGYSPQSLGHAQSPQHNAYSPNSFTSPRRYQKSHTTLSPAFGTLQRRNLHLSQGALHLAPPQPPQYENTGQYENTAGLHRSQDALHLLHGLGPQSGFAPLALGPQTNGLNGFSALGQSDGFAQLGLAYPQQLDYQGNLAAPAQLAFAPPPTGYIQPAFPTTPPSVASLQQQLSQQQRLEEERARRHRSADRHSASSSGGSAGQMTLHEPSLSRSTVGLDSLLRFSTKHTALPSITPSSGASPNEASLTPEGIFPRNGNVSEAEENELVATFASLVSVLNEKRAESLRQELRQYDPYDSGYAEASTVLRLCLNYFRQATTEHRTWQQLFRMFSRNPGRVREVHYAALVEWFHRLMDARRDGVDLAALAHSTGSTGAKADVDPSTTATTPSSPSSHHPGFHERGDAKLMVDVELALRDADEEALASLPKLDGAFNMTDRGHLGTLSREQVTNILRSFRLSQPLAPVLPRLLSRCDKQGRVDWALALKFLERGARNPLPTRATGRRPARRDMQSSTSNPLPASPMKNLLSQTEPPPPSPPQPRPASDPSAELERLRAEEASRAQQATRQAQLASRAMEQRAEEAGRLDQLSRIEQQIQALSMQSDDLRRQMETASQAARASSAQSHSNGERLMDALRLHDASSTGWISSSKARQVIQQYNDLHRLGLNARFVDSILALAADESERRVSLAVLSKYLSPD